MVRKIRSTGMKWELTADEFDKLFIICKRDGETVFGKLCLPGLEVECIFHNREKTFVTCEGNGGYIGLSYHGDMWHIGTPHFAVSEQLCVAMNKLIGTQ